MTATLVVLHLLAAPAAALPSVPTVVEAELREQATRAGFPNLLVGLVEDGKLIWKQRFGPAVVDGGSVYRVGSITKVFAALAVLKLRDAGKIGLEDRIDKWIPEMTVRPPSKDSPPPTIRHLLTHTSGLPPVGTLEYRSLTEPVTEAQLLAAVKDIALDFSPGDHTGYSNLGYALTGLIITRASGQPFRSYLRQEIFEPLGMKSTGFEAPAAKRAVGHLKKDGKYQPAPGTWQLGAAEAAGGLYTTLDDLVRFVAFQMAAWPARDGPDKGVVKRSTVRESQLLAGFARADGRAFGFSWSVVEDPHLGHVVKHGGSTNDYTAGVALAPRRGLGVIALVGTGDGPLILDLAMKALSTAGSRAPRSDPLGAPVKAALTRVRQLITAADVAGIEATFTPGFLSRLSAPKLEMAFANFRKENGTCDGYEVREVPTPVGATVRLACQKRPVELKLHVTAAPPHRVDELLFTPVPP